MGVQFEGLAWEREVGGTGETQSQRLGGEVVRR